VKKRGKTSKMWVRKPSMSKEEAVRFIEDYGGQHFLNDRVKSIRVKTRLNDFYIYATVWNYYGKCWYEDPVARLQWRGDDTYQLAYFRHTGKWHNIFELVGTLKECLDWVNENAYDVFWE